MDRAITYSLSSVWNFHFSVHNAIEQDSLAWSRSDRIHDHAETFSTHQDPRSNATNPSRPNGNSQVLSRAKENYCKEWNYSGKCNCNISDASYKLVQCCCVCDSPEHAMLNCAKRKYPVPSHQPLTPSAEQSLVQLSDEVRAQGTPNVFGAQHPVHSGFNLNVWSQYLEHYEDRIAIDF